MLNVGTAIIVCGLKVKTKYNGNYGIVYKEYNSSSGRYGIKLHNNGKVLAIRPVNIKVNMKNCANNILQRKQSRTQLEKKKQIRQKNQTKIYAVTKTHFF